MSRRGATVDTEGDEWGTVGSEQLVCERDGAATRLCCAECRAGICPACLVRTPVGHKCPDCAGGTAPVRPRRRAGLAGIAGAAVVALAVSLTLLRSTGGTTSDPVAVETSVGEPVATRQVMLGEEARDGQLVFVAEDFACRPKDVSPDAPTPPTAGKLCTLRFNVRNTSNGPATLLGRFQYLVDAQGRTYGADEALTRAVPENANRSLSELNINPDVVVPLALVFDVPATVEPIEAQFRGTGRSRFGVNVRLERR